MANNRPGKTRRIAMSFLVLYMLLAVSGCRQTDSCIQAIDTIPDALDPLIHKSYNNLQIFSQIYETLVTLSPDKQTILPNLAGSWSYSAGNRHLTFRLKPGIYFHDLTGLDAYAATYCIDWIRKKEADAPYLLNIDSVVVIDSLTFRLELKKPDARFIYYLASGTGIVMISKEALLRYDENIRIHPAGTGPFYLDQWTEDRIVLDRFDAYRAPGGNIANLQFLLYPYSGRLEKALQAGEVDIVYAVTGYAIDRLRWSGEIDYIVNEPIYCTMLAFNLKNRTMQDRNLRKAVLAAIDREQLVIHLYRSAAIPADNPLPPIFPYFADLKQPPHDPRQGSELYDLTGTGLDDLELVYPDYAFLRPVLLEALKTYLRDAGITLNIHHITSVADYETAIRSDSTQLFFYGWRSDILGDPGNFLWSLFHSTSEYNLFRYRNQQVDHLLEIAVAEFDNMKRIEYYRNVVRQVLEDTPAVFLNHLKEYYAYNAKKIKSISMNPYGIINYNEVMLDETH